MKYLDLSLTEEPVDHKGFRLLKEKDHPYVCAGIQIKNKFDQDRISFNKGFKSDNIFHFIYDKGNISCMCLKALPLAVNHDFVPLIQQLKQNSGNNLNVYKNLLSEFNLSCDNCFGYFGPNTYPIDGKHVNQIAVNITNEKELYTKILNTTEIPPYQSFGYFSIFILTHNPFITDALKRDFCKQTGMA